MKKSELMKMIREEIKLLKEIKNDRSDEIKKDYKELKRKSIKDIRAIWKRSHRVGDETGGGKEILISDILVDRYGEKSVENAFK